MNDVFPVGLMTCIVAKLTSRWQQVDYSEITLKQWGIRSTPGIDYSVNMKKNNNNLSIASNNNIGGKNAPFSTHVLSKRWISSRWRLYI